MSVAKNFSVKLQVGIIQSNSDEIPKHDKDQELAKSIKLPVKNLIMIQQNEGHIQEGFRSKQLSKSLKTRRR